MHFDVLDHSVPRWRTRETGFEQPVAKDGSETDRSDADRNKPDLLVDKRYIPERFISLQSSKHIDGFMEGRDYFERHLLPTVHRFENPENGDIRVVAIGSPKHLSFQRNPDTGTIILREEVQAEEHERPMPFMVTDYYLVRQPNDTYHISGGTCRVSCGTHSFQQRELGSKYELSGSKLDALIRLCACPNLNGNETE